MPESPSPRPLRIDLGGDQGPVSALLLLPEDVALLYVLAHGAGAGMTHPFLEAMARALAAVGIGTLRYQFPYMEAGRRRPDPPSVAQSTVRVAVTAAANAAPGLPLMAGGKSFGGRMTSQAAAQEPLPGVCGLVFLGFPLHPPRRPGNARAAHLGGVHVPMLFLQGTRDDFAERELIEGVCGRLGERATLHLVSEADHSFKVAKRTGRSAEDVLRELAETIFAWGKKVSGKR